VTVQRRVFKSTVAPVETAPEAATEPADASGEVEALHVIPEPVSALARAQQALAENDRAIADLVAQRNALLVRDEVNDAEVERIDAELARHQHRQRTLSDRLSLLGEEARREAAEQAALAHEAKIKTAEDLFTRRDEAAADLQRHLQKAEEAFRRVHALGIEARAGWPWAHGKLGGTMTTASDLIVATASYIYKIGSRGGGRDPAGTPGFPGGKCPRIELMHNPAVLPDLLDEFTAASRYGSDTMRGVVRLDAVSPSPAPPSAVGAAPAQSPPVVAAVESAHIPPITPEIRKLLERQNALASRVMSEADEAEYEANGELIKGLSA
jgi:hypothetical protein